MGGAAREDAVARVLIPPWLARWLFGGERLPVVINLNLQQLLLMGCFAVPAVWALFALAARLVDGRVARRDDDMCKESTWAAMLPSNAEIQNVTFVPKGGSAGEGPTNVLYPINPYGLPELCAVTVRVVSSPSSAYRFGLFLPSSPHDWKQRFFAAGNGGFGGGERVCLTNIEHALTAE
jgi:hypothetical protein